MLMMALLPPGGLGGYGGDPDGVNGSWEEACTCVSTSIRVRVAVAAGEYPRHLPQRLFLMPGVIYRNAFVFGCIQKGWPSLV